MHIQNLSISTIAFLVITSCGCIAESINAADSQPTSEVKTEKKTVSTIKEPQIQQEWQNKFLEIFKKQPKEQKLAMALFSYGGWSNDGQVLIFGEDSSGGTSMYSTPGSKEISTSKSLSSSRFASFTGKLKNFENLADVDTGVMDGLQFEFVRAVRDDKGEIKIVQRVFMNNPGVGKPAPQHTELVNLFSEFKAGHK